MSALVDEGPPRSESMTGLSSPVIESVSAAIGEQVAHSSGKPSNGVRSRETICLLDKVKCLPRASWPLSSIAAAISVNCCVLSLLLSLADGANQSDR